MNLKLHSLAERTRLGKAVYVLAVLLTSSPELITQLCPSGIISCRKSRCEPQFEAVSLRNRREGYKQLALIHILSNLFLLLTSCYLPWTDVNILALHSAITTSYLTLLGFHNIFYPPPKKLLNLSFQRTGTSFMFCLSPGLQRWKNIILKSYTSFCFYFLGEFNRNKSLKPIESKRYF